MNRESHAGAAPRLRRRLGKGLALFGSVLALGLPPQLARAQGQAQQPPSGLPSGPVVVAPAGPVQGLNNNGVYEYLGIPYAQPPVGALRWQPPQPAASWTQTLNATQFGPTCAQITTLGVFAGPANANEDCLYLNVFTPKVNAGAALPVLVWIHGGGNVDGESNDYDGSKLASQGQAVVVTLNYRLGLLGWFANPALDAEGHPFGNYGLLDQQLVLKWVQSNIASFGGDPTRVALGGQSAGSQDTSANVASPLAAGLFNRAIFMSALSDSLSLTTAEQRGAAFSTAAGCGAGADSGVAACLRNLSVQTILGLQGTQSANGPYVTGPVSDGTILPTQGISSALASGAFNHMPIISGWTHDEGNFSIAIQEYFSGSPPQPITEANLTAYVQTTYGANAAKVLAAFDVGSYATPQLAYDAIATAGTACRQYGVNQALSSQVPLYGYEFDDQTAPFYFPDLPDFQSLAYHTSDIQYVFPLYHGGSSGIPHPLNAQQEQLSDQMVAFWTRFAATGNPNPNPDGNRVWPRYDASQATSSYYLSENIPSVSLLRDMQLFREHRCGAWQRLHQ